MSDTPPQRAAARPGEARELTPHEHEARKVVYGTLASSPMPDVVRKLFVARVTEAIAAAERRGAEAKLNELLSRSPQLAAVLDALREWNKAETAWEHCRLVQGAGEVRSIMERRKAATAALRAAAVNVLKGEG